MKTKIKNFFVRHFSAILIGVLLMSAFAATFGMIGTIRERISTANLIHSPATVTLDDAVAAAIGEHYIVKEYDGRIGVYVPGDTQPIKVIQVYIMYLPESDRAELREGINVNGKTALNALLEEFNS